MKKLRRFHNNEAQHSFYEHHFSHRSHESHISRVEHTIKIGQGLIDRVGIKTIADFSAGDRAIVMGLAGYEEAWLSDYSDDGVDILDRLREDTRTYDLFVCTETIEHVEQPWTLLEEIAKRTTWILLSTPLDEDPTENNWEHYWSFGADDVDDLLTQAGFDWSVVNVFKPATGPYTYQIWIAHSEEVA